MIRTVKPAPHVSPLGERLSKRVAEVMSCSRREAELYIAGGWVRVDGLIVEEPHFRVLHQQVELDKNASLLDVTQVTLLLHKPPGYDSGDDEPHAKAGAAKDAPHSARQLLTPATRMSDDNSDISDPAGPARTPRRRNLSRA